MYLQYGPYEHFEYWTLVSDPSLLKIYFGILYFSTTLFSTKIESINILLKFEN